jgi:uroporphyrinogen III methyltransferase/synthase
MTQDTTLPGFVYLVGAGPGDPSYITLRAAECLEQADVVLYDFLANPLILQHVRFDARRICLGRHGIGKLWTQQEINDELVRLAQQGLKVVRLKGGDPAIFARCAEETHALTLHNIDYEVVPGITAAMAAGSCVGVPLTHRDRASAVAFVTGSEQTGKESSALDFQALAKFPGTLVFYMGVTTAELWTNELITNGKSPDTPVMIVRRISCADQFSVKCTLSEVQQYFTGTQRIRPPAIVIVGEVAGATDMNSWFEQRLLFGQRILVTRSAEQAQELTAKLTELGADVLVQPAIEIGPPESYEEVDQIIHRLSDFTWIVFSSRNGGHYFLERLATLGLDARQFAGVKIAAMGPGTAAALQQRHLKCDLIPAEYRAESLAESLRDEASGSSVLLVRASRGRDTLCDMLQSDGAEVTQVVAYVSRDVTEIDPVVAAALAAGEVDWITVTSSAIGRSLVTLLGSAFGQAKVASISSITSGVLSALEVTVDAEAQEHSLDGLILAITESLK